MKEDKYREEISSEEVEKYMQQRTSTSAERPKVNTDVAPEPVQKHAETIPTYHSDETETSSINPLRTYKDDVARTISRRKTSLTSMVIAESRRRLHESKAHEEKSSRNIKKTVITAISALLIVSGVVSASYFYIKNRRDSVTEPVARISALIFADAQEEFDVTGLTGNQVMSLLTTERDRAGELSLGSIKHLYLTENTQEGRKLVDAREFLQTIGTHVKKSYLRSLNSPFMLGFHVFSGSQPFLILKVGFFEGAFAGMLEWEEFLREDLSPLFGQAPAPIPAVEFAIPSQLNTATAFTDVVIKNKDTRVLRDENGNVALLYSFIDRQTVVITTNENTFIEIFTRMTSSRVSQ